MRTFFGILALFLDLSLASPGLVRSKVHERRDTAPAGFILRSRSQDSTSLSLPIVLKHMDAAGLEKEIEDISTPGNSRYGQVLSREQVQAYVNPAQESFDAVERWLLANGLDKDAIARTSTSLDIKIDVKKANELFDADFADYEDIKTGQVVPRTLSYSLPHEIKRHIRYIQSAASFPVSPKRILSSVEDTPGSSLIGRALPGACGTATYATPACLQALYGIPTTPAKNSSNYIAVAGYNGNEAHYTDITGFLTQFRPDMSSTTSFDVVSVNGGQNPQNGTADLEPTADLQYTVGLATGIPVKYFPVKTTTTSGYTLLFQHILNMTDPPKVVTVSYGNAETDYTLAEASYTCFLAGAVTARGTIIVLSSGDSGVGNDETCSQFRPGFPATCPYITAVGGTSLKSPEVGAVWTSSSTGDKRGSTGGFSWHFTRSNLTWQSTVVPPYLDALGSTFSGKYNADGRGTPDVSAIAFVRILIDGATTGFVGTSASAPIFASILALINDELVSAGKSLPGYINKTLYLKAVRSAFTDITSGNNPGAYCVEGFNATAGWDPMTGLGTPNYPKLLSALKAAL